MFSCSKYFPKQSIFFNFFNITEKYLKKLSISSTIATCDFCVPLLYYPFFHFFFLYLYMLVLCQFLYDIFIIFKWGHFFRASYLLDSSLRKGWEIKLGQQIAPLCIHLFIKLNSFPKFLPGDRILHTSLRDVPI